MPSKFLSEKPLQAIKLTAVIGALTFGLASLIGLLPGQVLNGLLYLTFFPIILGVIVGAEALLTGYQLAVADDPATWATTRRWYKAIRAIELVGAVGAPTTFYVLIVQIGGEVPGPGAIGLLFIGTGLAFVAYTSVLLRTLTEYYTLRKRSSHSKAGERSGNAAE